MRFRKWGRPRSNKAFRLVVAGVAGLAAAGAGSVYMTSNTVAPSSGGETFLIAPAGQACALAPVGGGGGPATALTGTATTLGAGC